MKSDSSKIEERPPVEESELNQQTQISQMNHALQALATNESTESL